MKLISIIHGLRSLNIFVHNVDGFFGILERYKEVVPSFPFGNLFNYTQFKTKKNAYLNRTEQIDRVMSGLSKCAYARFLDFDIVSEVEQFAL